MLEMFDKLDDIIYAPVKAVSNWLEEPLRRMDHAREKEKAQQAAELEAWRAQEQERLRQAANQADVDLQNMAADAQFARNKAAVEAIKQYQIDLAKANAAMIENIGRMSLALRTEAQEMVNTYTERYRAQQEEALQKADARMADIQTRYADNDRVREKMEDTVIVQITSIITFADKFVGELAEDLKKINDMTDRLVGQAMDNTQEIVRSLPIGVAKEAFISGANPALTDGK
jgi:hypothetical protein